MRVHVVNFLRPDPDYAGRTLEYLSGLARQVPVRHPVELAHRIGSLYALTGSRLQLGVGSGSTQADFDLVGLDYNERFKMLMSGLDTMGRAWRGENLPGGA